MSPRALATPCALAAASNAAQPGEALPKALWKAHSTLITSLHRSPFGLLLFSGDAAGKVGGRPARTRHALLGPPSGRRRGIQLPGACRGLALPRSAWTHLWPLPLLAWRYEPFCAG